MLRAKYHNLRKGIDNIEYLENLCTYVVIQSPRSRVLKTEIKGLRKELRSLTLKRSSNHFGSTR